VVKWSKRHQGAVATACLGLMLAVIALAIGLLSIAQQKAETTKALALAEQQERKAKGQYLRAESNLDWALNVTHHVLARLDGDEFADFPAAHEIRARLVARAVTEFQARIDEGNTDPAVRQDTARIYGAIGLLHSGQADHQKATAAFEKARVILRALTSDWPDDPRIWKGLGHTQTYLAAEFEFMGERARATEERRRAVEAFSEVVRLDPDNPQAVNNLAWYLACFPDPGVHDPRRAVALANEAVRLSPTKADYWNTLALARYRAGDWRGSIAAARTSTSLCNGSEVSDWFILAMASWQVGEKEEARRWFDKAVRATSKDFLADADLRRFWAEAAKLMGVKGPPPKPKEPRTDRVHKP
jgi:tetratricopeptide (TPR) repeat protein